MTHQRPTPQSRIQTDTLPTSPVKAAPAGLIVRPMRADEVMGVADGIARNMSRSEAAARWMGEVWPHRILHSPGFQPDQCRVAEVGGQIVAHAMVAPYTLRYGGARLQVAGIGKVYTEAAHRMRGYGAAVLRDALAYAVEQGAHLAILHGIRGYYGQFGFSPVWPEYVAEFDSAELAALDCPLNVRLAELRDLPYMAALFERTWGGRVTLTREVDLWRWRLAGGDFAPHGDDARQALVVVGEDDVPQGYIAGRGLTDWLVEVAAGTPDAALSLLAYSGHWHHRENLDQTRWHLPPDDPLVAFAQQVVGVRLSANTLPDGGWMGRVVNMPGLLAALGEEIEQQARQSLPRLRPGDLILESHAQGVAVGLRAYPATVSHIKQRDFIQVLFGSVSPTGLGLRANLTEAMVDVLRVCFPPRVAALGAWDWF